LNLEASAFLEWDASSGTIIKGPTQFTDQPDSHRSVLLSRDGRRFVASGTSPDDPSLSYDIESGTSKALNVGYNFGTVISQDGKKLLAFSMPIAVWDTVAGNVMTTGQPGLNGEAAFAEISADGKRAVSVTTDEKVTIWDVDSVDIIGGPYRDHQGAVKSIAFSPDATHLAIGLSTGSIVLMECNSGDLKPTPGEFEGHRDWVKSVAFSPDGKWLCSGSEDGTIKVWDIETGYALARPARHQGKVWSVSFSIDGRKILSNGSDRTVRVWIIENYDN
jgi:WD40 repeat protein